MNTNKMRPSYFHAELLFSQNDNSIRVWVDLGRGLQWYVIGDLLDYEMLSSYRQGEHSYGIFKRAAQGGSMYTDFYSVTSRHQGREHMVVVPGREVEKMELHLKHQGRTHIVHTNVTIDEYDHYAREKEYYLKHGYVWIVFDEDGVL